MVKKTVKTSLSKGITLTETLFSTILLVSILILAINLIVISKVSGSLSKHKTQAIYIVQRMIEDLRKKPFSSIAGSVSAVSIDTRGTPEDYSDDLMGTGTVTVGNVNYYKKVVVEIRWNELIAGGSKTVKECCGTHIANDPQAN